MRGYISSLNLFFLNIKRVKVVSLLILVVRLIVLPFMLYQAILAERYGIGYVATSLVSYQRISAILVCILPICILYDLVDGKGNECLAPCGMFQRLYAHTIVAFLLETVISMVSVLIVCLLEQFSISLLFTVFAQHLVYYLFFYFGIYLLRSTIFSGMAVFLAHVIEMAFVEKYMPNYSVFINPFSGNQWNVGLVLIELSIVLLLVTNFLKLRYRGNI